MQSAATHISVQPEQVEQQQQHIGILTVRLPQKMLWMHSQCGTKATALMIVYWNYFKKPLNNELKTTAPQKQRPSTSTAAVQNVGCSSKMKHGKTTCDANRPKELEEYALKCLRGLGTLWPQHCPRCSFGHGSPSREFVDLTDWET